MSISSRTPEGFPIRCPVCGAETWMELSLPPGDTLCPACGQLVWGDQETALLLQLCEQLGVEPHQLLSDEPFGIDSLDTVELAMALEESFDLDLNPSEAAPIRTWRDCLQYLITRRRRLP